MKTFKTRQEVASLLGVSRRTLQRIIVRLQLNIPPRRLLSPEDQRKIFHACGVQ